MIKAIILDVDGVIVGEKIGYNSPQPHKDVMHTIKTIRNKGIAICLCTAKPHSAVSEIIRGAALHNPHITDAGAVIIDPIDNIIVEEHIIEKNLAKDILGTLISADVYTEFYTVEDYFIQKSQESGITKQHTHILQKEPSMLVDISKESSKYNITKIMPIARDSRDKNRVATLLQQYAALIHRPNRQQFLFYPRS